MPILLPIIIGLLVLASFAGIPNETFVPGWMVVIGFLAVGAGAVMMFSRGKSE